MSFRLTFTVAVAAASASIAQGQEPDTAAARVPSRVFAYETPYQIVYDHIRDTLKLVDNRGKVLERWHRFRPSAPATLVGVPPDRPIEVVVENANPLLYRYSVRVDVVQARNAQTCRMVGRSFAQRAFLTAAGAVGGTTAPALDVSRALSTDVLTTITSLGAGKSGGSKGLAVPSTLSETAARAESQRLATSAQRILMESGDRLTAYAELLDTITHYGTKSDSTLRDIARRGETTAADALLEDLQLRFDRSHRGLSDPALFVEIFRTRSAAAAVDLAAVDNGIDMVAEAAVLLRPYDARAADALASGPTAQGLASVKQRVPVAARKALTPAQDDVSAATKAQALLMTVRDLRIEARDEQFTAHPSGDLRRVTLRLEASTMWKDEMRTRTGEAAIYVEPRVGRSCEISAGLAWLGSPELAVKDGKVVPGDDDLRTPPAVFVTIAPRPRSVAGATFGVGLGQYRRPDFFAGATWRWLSPVLITGGAALQRHPLAAEADDTKIRYKMKVSWFGALTMSLSGSR